MQSFNYYAQDNKFQVMWLLRSTNKITARREFEQDSRYGVCRFRCGRYLPIPINGKIVIDGKSFQVGILGTQVPITI